MASKGQKQLSLPGFGLGKAPSAHGGDLARGRRKTRRPFDPKQALHVVLRSSKARGERSMLHPRHCNAIRGQVDRLQKRWGVRVYRYANVGNHLHLLVRCRTRRGWQGFIRELAGAIAMIVTGARKGHALEGGRFWDGLVFTRIVRFGRDFERVGRYVATNLWEGAGVPVRKLLARGLRVLDISEDGAVLVHAGAPPEVLEALGRLL